MISFLFVCFFKEYSFHELISLPHFADETEDCTGSHIIQGYKVAWCLNEEE